MLGRAGLPLSFPIRRIKKAGSGILNPEDDMAVARHEIFCTLEDVLERASGLLCFRGRFAMVHRPDRLMDILTGMRQYRLEPKQIRLVHPQIHKAPNLVLIEAVFMEALP